MIKEILLIGAHVSSAGGFEKAIERAQEIGAVCIQIFTKSNRQWHAKKITQEQADRFKEAQKKSDIRVVIVHSSYLINMGSKTAQTVEKSIHALAQELDRCEQLNIPYLVLHPGSMHSSDEKESLQFIAENIDKAFALSAAKKVMLLLETMAGQGSTTGYTFEQLAAIIKHSKNKRDIGVCFDTCHAFASGYKFDTPASYKKMWDEFDATIGLNKLKAFHMNNSKKEFGSRVDRHADIATGEIPAAAFAMILKDKRFKDIAKILETPQNDPVEDNKRNLATLRKYA